MNTDIIDKIGKLPLTEFTKSVKECPVCGSGTASGTENLGCAGILECRECRTARADPVLKKEYRRLLYSGGNSPSGPETVSLKEAAEGLLAGVCEILQKRGMEPSKSFLFDMGFGWGTFLEEAEEKFRKVSGCELSTDQFLYLGKRINADIHNLDFSEIPETRKFDCITAWDFIEHISNPVSFIKKCGRLLKEGGAVFLSTPNYDSIYRRIFGRKWYYYVPSEHLLYFSPATIQKILVENGFRVNEIYTYGRSGIYSDFHNSNIENPEYGQNSWARNLRFRVMTENNRNKPGVPGSFAARAKNGFSYRIAKLFSCIGKGDRIFVYAERNTI